MQESSSKTQFPLRLAAPSNVSKGKESPRSLRIISTGIRTKLMFQVYAYGIYCDEEPFFRDFNARFSSTKADALAKDPKFFSFVAGGRFSRAISLCMLRDITGEDLKEAFNISLGERLRKFEHEVKSGDDEADPDDALHQFQSQFSGRKLSKGTRLVFVWDHSGKTLRTYISDEPVGAVKSELLNRCLWDVYCGEAPIDKNAKLLLAKTTASIASKKRQSDLKAKL